MLNALEGSDYNSLRGHLIAQFQNAKSAPDQKEVYDSIAFAGYKHKRRATEQAHIAKFQKGPSLRNDVRCKNPKCKSPKGHATEKCWFEGGASAHLAPAQWKASQARKAKAENLVKANAAEEEKTPTESANAAMMLERPLVDYFQDRYESYACIYAGESGDYPAESWSGVWDEKTVTMGCTDKSQISKPGGEEVCTAAYTQPPYCIDSGCTSHCSPVRSYFIDLTPIPHRAVHGMNGSSIPAIGVGTIRLKCGKGRKLTLKNVLFVPDAALQLISVGKLADDNFITIFEEKMYQIHNKSGKTIADGTRKGQGLYYFADNDPKNMECAFISRASPDLATWHCRLGHINYTSIIRMVKKSLAIGMPVNLSTLPPICEHCIAAKQTKTPVPKTRGGERAKRRLEKVHSDISGPEDVGTLYGEKYMLNLIDDYSGMAWIYPLKKKSDAPAVFLEWKALVKNESGEHVKLFRTDNGGKFTSDSFALYLRGEGIRHQTTAPYTSAENGKSERLHRTIMNRARAIRTDSKLPLNMWGEAVKAASYLKNRMPTRTLVDKTPYKMWYGRRPDVSHLRELGCKVWVHILGDNPKIYNWSIECVLVGYSENSKMYCCLGHSSGRIHVSRNMFFTESQDLRERPLPPGLT